MWRRWFKRAPRVLASRDAYRLWARSYVPRTHNPLMEAEEAAMTALLPPLEGKSVLDLACGSGRYTRIALEHGASLVIGVDNSLDMLAVGRQDVATGRFIGATTEAVPLKSASFDVIVCGLALGHLPTLSPSLSEIARLLAPDGVALISDFHPFLALNGKQRTFTSAEGHVFAIEHYPHLYSDMLATAQSVGLAVTQIREPHLVIDGAECPAVIVYRLHKR